MTLNIAFSKAFILLGNFPSDLISNLKSEARTFKFHWQSRNVNFLKHRGVDLILFKIFPHATS